MQLNYGNKRSGGVCFAPITTSSRRCKFSLLRGGSSSLLLAHPCSCLHVSIYLVQCVRTRCCHAQVRVANRKARASWEVGQYKDPARSKCFKGMTATCVPPAPSSSLCIQVRPVVALKYSHLIVKRPCRNNAMAEMFFILLLGAKY
jgi:hypothetical protein